MDNRLLVSVKNLLHMPPYFDKGINVRQVAKKTLVANVFKRKVHYIVGAKIV